MAKYSVRLQAWYEHTELAGSVMEVSYRSMWSTRMSRIL